MRNRAVNGKKNTTRSTANIPRDKRMRFVRLIFYLSMNSSGQERDISSKQSRASIVCKVGRHILFQVFRMHSRGGCYRFFAKRSKTLSRMRRTMNPFIRQVFQVININCLTNEQRSIIEHSQF